MSGYAPGGQLPVTMSDVVRMTSVDQVARMLIKTTHRHCANKQRASCQHCVDVKRSLNYSHNMGVSVLMFVLCQLRVSAP